MAVVGFGFTKMLIEKKGDIKGKIDIKNHVAIKEVSKIDMSLGKIKQNALRIDFEFKSSYEPNVAQILFEGNILDIEDEKKIEELIKGWAKEKKLSQDIMEPVINSILTRCNVQALIMSRDLNLPPPIPLPKVQSQKVSTGAAGAKQSK